MGNPIDVSLEAFASLYKPGAPAQSFASILPHETTRRIGMAGFEPASLAKLEMVRGAGLETCCATDLYRVWGYPPHVCDLALKRAHPSYAFPSTPTTKRTQGTPRRSRPSYAFAGRDGKRLRVISSVLHLATEHAGLRHS